MKHRFLPNCENPQLITADVGPLDQGPVFRRCGHCWSCKGATARTRAGQLIGESQNPYSDLWREPGWVQFWTVTDPDSCIPMTTPVAHDLTLNMAGTAPYGGPFPKLWREKRWGHWVRITKHDGIAYKDTGHSLRPLSPEELIDAQVAHFRLNLGWDSGQIADHIEGTYPSLSTLEKKPIQDHIKRCRRWFERHYPDLPMFRLSKKGEYGDEKGRAHHHFILYGWPPYRDAQEYWAYSWQQYHDMAIIDPDPKAAWMFKKSWVDVSQAAVKYTCGDLVKDRRNLWDTPAKAARRDPYLHSTPGLRRDPDTKKPLRSHPLGQVSMEIWLGTQIAQALDKAGSDEVDQCAAARQSYTHHTLLVNGQHEVYPTTAFWKNEVKRIFDPDIWLETTHRLNAEHADHVLEAERDPALEQDIEDHISAVAEKNRRNEKRTLDRKKRKSAVRRSARRF